MQQYSEFNRVQGEIEKSINKVFSDDGENKSRVHEIASGEAFVRLVQLINPVILTPGQEIKISGPVFLLSTQELIKILKNRYQTPGSINAFPQVVEDFIQTGESALFIEVRGSKNDEAKKELQRVSQIITNRKGLIFLSSVDPIYPVDEFTTNGKHSSGEYLTEIELPAIISADEADFPFNCPLGARITDGRREKNMTVKIETPGIIVNSIENNVVVVTNKGSALQGDAVTILSILFLGIGVGMALMRRGKMLEFAIPLIVIGAGLLVLRFWSDWGKTHFGLPPKIEVSGNAPMNLKFYGVLV